MKNQGSGYFRYILIVGLVLLLVRFSPVWIRIFQAIAIGVRSYWWAILPLLIVAIAIRKIKKRKDKNATENKYQFERRPLRDVTDSVDGEVT